MAESEAIKAAAGPDLSEAFRSPVARPPSDWKKGFDIAFRNVAHAFGVLAVLLLAGIVFEVMRHAKTAIADYGFGFLTTSVWDPNRAQFGILAEIAGTLYTSILALGIGGFLGVTVALVLSQGFVPRRVELVMKNVIELLAAIPSVVYGL